MNLRRVDIFLIVFIALCAVRVALFVLDSQVPMVYAVASEAEVIASSTEPLPVAPFKPIVTHVPTPSSVKAIYMTSWVAGTPSLRDKVLKIIDDTEVNAVVIDIKDHTGRITFAVDDPYLQEIGSVERRIRNMREMIETLHSKGVYVIGRISSFQDAYLSQKRPDLAVRRESDDGVWGDRKGISWLDAGSTEVWDYLVAIGKESYAQGFDELNFDYIRFPSDGNMKDIKYHFYDEATLTKSEQMNLFFAYLHDHLAPTGAVLSVDLFGLTTSSPDDLGIGQVLENALAHFDYVAPMIYPSHYPPDFNGYKNPAAVPYEIITYAMEGAIAKAEAASTTRAQLRPWLQDFDLGADYTADMIRLEKKALYDLGIDSWMMWDPSNKYTSGAFDKESGGGVVDGQ